MRLDNNNSGSKKPKKGGGSQRPSGASSGRGGVPSGRGGSGASRGAKNGVGRGSSGEGGGNKRPTSDEQARARKAAQQRELQERRKLESEERARVEELERREAEVARKQGEEEAAKSEAESAKTKSKSKKRKPKSELTETQLKWRKRKKIGIAIVVILALVFGGIFVFNRFINPQIADTPDSLSGAGSLKAWEAALQSNDVDALNALVENSLVAQENNYAGESKARGQFVSAVLSTVEYTIPEVEQKTIYGGIKTKDGQPVMAEDDLMGDGDTVTLSYVDWASVELDPESVKSYLERKEISADDPDIRVKLTDAFAQYIADLSQTEEGLPTKEVEWVPSFDESKVPDPEDEKKTVMSRKVDAAEDENLDKVLFSGKDFWRLQTEFSIAALDQEPGADWADWIGGLSVAGGSGEKSDSSGKSSSGTSEEGVSAPEDSEDASTDTGGEPAAPSDGGGETTNPSDGGGDLLGEEKEEPTGPTDIGFPGEEIMPDVGNYSFISPYWIGSWFLQRGIVEEGELFETEVDPVTKPRGDGTKESPAGLNTSVYTIQYDKTKDGKIVENPIRVELKQVSTGQEALNFYQSKDTRNRGFTTQSQVNYMAMRFKVTNLSENEITIRDNSSLSDDQINLTGRTGTVFGLTREVTLKPGESGIIESWAGSPTLDRSYLLWGADYDRRHDVVWFRILAGSEGSIDPVAERDDAAVQGEDEAEVGEENTGIVEGNEGVPDDSAASSDEVEE